jgi:hypothetical protein
MKFMTRKLGVSIAKQNIAQNVGTIIMKGVVRRIK